MTPKSAIPREKTRQRSLALLWLWIAPRRKDGDQEADFINCVSFGKRAEFAEKYLRKGTKIAVVGRIQTGSYTNKDGNKVYTTDVIIEEQEFAEGRANGSVGIPDRASRRVIPAMAS